MTSACAACAQRRLPRRVKLPGPLGRYNVYYKLLTARGWNAYKKNELNADKITNMSLRLNYEAVVQYAGIEDNDLLYFSYANQVRTSQHHGRCMRCSRSLQPVAIVAERLPPAAALYGVCIHHCRQDSRARDRCKLIADTARRRA